MTRHALHALDLAWITFALYWLIKASNTRQTQRRESFSTRYLVMLFLVAGYVLISRLGRIGVLSKRFLPAVPVSDVRVIVWFGIVVTWLGVALAIWARHHLAENWSSLVTIKHGHELIRTGPYARLRHPIYSGILLAAVGTSLAVGEWHCLLGVGLVWVGFSLKAKFEEAMLTEQFGEAFQEHRRHTGFLLPRL